MRHKKRSKSLGLASIIMLTASLSSVVAQECINSTGGNHSGTGGSMSYTVGQVDYATYKGTTGSLAQGVQQSYEISVVTGLEKAKGISLSVSAYPNPTTDFLQLQVDASALLSIQSLTYQLFDIQGKLLQSEKIIGKQTSIVMSNLIPATYFIKVIQGNKSIKTFKIIKN
ncbi:MAG: T9SS type A sorting domain-containing protein [bacterium]